MQRAREPRTFVAARPRYALSTPPLNATIADSQDASSSRRRASLLVEILLFLVLVEIVFVVLILFEFVLVLVVQIVVFVAVGEIDLVGTDHDEGLATLRTAQGVPLLEVLGVNLVEVAFRTGRHTGSMQRQP